MADHPWQLRARAPRLVRPVAVDPSGRTGPTRGQAAGPWWRRSSPGLYVPAEVDRDLPEQRILEQGVRLPPGAAVTGWAALRLHGAHLSDGLQLDGRTHRPVPVVVGSRGSLRPGAEWVISFERVPTWETQRVGGITVTRPERALYDAMRSAGDLVEAVVVADLSFAAEVTSRQRMLCFATGHASMRRSTLAGRALALASERSWSPQESRTRLLLSQHAGCRRLVSNAEVMVGSAPVGVVDLLDEEAGVVVEYDGADHRRLTRQAFDITKEDLLRRAGLEVVRVTSLHLARPDLLLERFRAARDRVGVVHRAPSSGAARRWWVRPPSRTLDDVLTEREVSAWLMASYETGQ